MSKDSVTIWRSYPCKLKWAKVFEHNRDNALDKDGKELDNDAAQTVRDRGGMYSTVMCVTDATKAKMIADGIPETSLGFDQFHPCEEYAEEGYNWEYRAKNYVLSKSINPETGEPYINEAPVVADLNNIYEDEEGEKRATPWNVEEQGELGNGTEAVVTVTIWKQKAKRVVALRKIGVKKLEEYKELVKY